MPRSEADKTDERKILKRECSLSGGRECSLSGGGEYRPEQRGRRKNTSYSQICVVPVTGYLE